MNKEKLKEKFKEVSKCYTNMKPETKRVIHYTLAGFGAGMVLGILVGRRR